MNSGQRRSLRRSSTAEGSQLSSIVPSPPRIRKRAASQLPESIPFAKRRKLASKSSMSSKKVNKRKSSSEKAVEAMDTDDSKLLRSSASIPIAGKKREQAPKSTGDSNMPEEDEDKGIDMFASGDSDEDDVEEVQGGLFGDVEPTKTEESPGAPLQRLTEQMMNLDATRAFNPVAGGGGRWKEYLTGLQSDDEMAQLDALINLADELCVMTEETANGFKLDNFIPSLVLMLSASDNPNMVLLACRCMSHILEALPGSENSFVRHDAIPGLVEKLLNIEYDDLRDQAMNVLSRLCANPTSASAVLKNGGLCAILANLDFSAINTQVTAVTCAANMLRHIPSDTWPQIRDALPTLSLLLQYEDPRLVEKATMSLASICTHFIGDSSKLEAVLSSGALLNLVRLVTERVERTTELSNLTWMVIRCLATLCKGLPGTAETLISTGIPAILKSMLLMERENATKGIRQSAKTNTQAVYDMVALADQLLPPLPADVASYLKSAAAPHPSYTGRARGLFATQQPQEIDLMSSGSIPPPADPSQPDARTVFYQKQPATLLQVAESLLGTMTLVFGSRINPQLRVKCLSTVAKIIFACTPEMLASLLKDLTFSSFLAGLLASKELKFIAVAISIAENLMIKLHDIFSAYFMREGVVHEVELLIACGAQFKAAPSSASTPTRPSAPSTPSTTTPVPSTPVDSSYIMPITPTSAPSFMWEALASPPNPSIMKARFGNKDANPSASPANTTSTPISFGSASPKTALTTSGGAVQFGSSPSSSSLPVAPADGTGENSGSLPTDTTISAPGDAPQPPNTTEIMRLEVVEKCTQFKKRWFALDGSSSEGLSQLSNLSSNLTDTLWAEKDLEKLKATLATVADIFLSGISTHEFVHSSLPTALFQFLTLSDTEAPTPRLERIVAFVQIFGKRVRSNKASAMEVDSGTNGSNRSITSPWLQLVKELQNAIEKNENFQVKMNPAMTSGGIRANAIVEFLTKAFTVKLMKDPSEKNLPVIPEGPVSVEPLATGRSIKDFIWTKVNRAIAQESKRSAEAAKKASEDKSTNSTSSTPVSSRTRSKTEQSPSPSNSMEVEESSTPSKRSGKRDRKTPSKSSDDSGAESPSSSAPRTKAEKKTPSKSGETTSASPSTKPLPPAEAAPPSLSSSSSSSLYASTSSNQDGDSAPLYGDIGEGDDDLDAIDEDNMERGEEGLYVQEVSSSARPDSPPLNLASPASNVATAHNLLLALNGSPLSDPVSFFKLLKEKATESLPHSESEIAAPLAPLWSQTHTIHYKLDPSAQLTASPAKNSAPVAPLKASQNVALNSPGSVLRSDVVGASLERVLDNLMRGEVGATCSFDKTLVQLLSLLKVLETLNLELTHIVPLAAAEDIIPVPASDFINAKLTAKLARQLQDPLALCTNTLPPWCASLCTELPFLFPLDLRQLYFRGSSLGVPRALLALKDRVEGVLDGNFGRIAPHKVRVERDSIRHLNSAFVVLQRIRGDSRSMLEVEYANEVATGAGPTLEFYTLVSHAFQQTKLSMWVADGKGKIIRQNANPNAMQTSTSDAALSTATAPTSNGSTKGDPKSQNSELEIVSNPGGLFPLPILATSNSDDAKETIKRFSFLGTFIAKAIMDDRMIDLPFSVAFFKGLLGTPLILDDLHPIYPQLVDTIRDFQDILAEKKKIELDTTMDEAARKAKVQALKYKGGSIDAMWLTFDLPGVNLELVPGGSDKALTIYNLHEWVDLVVDAISGSGVAAQFAALQAGFSHIFDGSRLAVFEPQELETLICGSLNQDWSKDAILEAATYSQGYTVNSKVAQWFATMLSEFTEAERRKFLRFATGSPRLPPRGFKGFHHRLTLSRKDPEKNRKADDYYPSVSTCFLFIKIPDYSTFAVFKERFITAIENGQQGFGLS